MHFLIYLLHTGMYLRTFLLLKGKGKLLQINIVSVKYFKTSFYSHTQLQTIILIAAKKDECFLLLVQVLNYTHRTHNYLKIGIIYFETHFLFLRR